MIPHMAVVRDMSIHHDQIIVADAGACFGSQAAVNGNILPDHIAAAKVQITRSLASPQMLRLAAEHGPLEHLIVWTEHRSMLDRHSTSQPTAVADHRSLFNHTERTNRDVTADFRLRRNQSQSAAH